MVATMTASANTTIGKGTGPRDPLDPTLQQVFTGVIVLAAVSVEVKAFGSGGVSVLGRLKQLGPFFALWLLLAGLVAVLVLRPPN